MTSLNERVAQILLDSSDTHDERMENQELEMVRTLTDNYQLDTLQKAINVDDSDQVLEMNRKQLYREPEVTEEGVVKNKESEGEEEMSTRTLQVGNNYYGINPQQVKQTQTQQTPTETTAKDEDIKFEKPKEPAPVLELPATQPEKPKLPWWVGPSLIGLGALSGGSLLYNVWPKGGDPNLPVVRPDENTDTDHVVRITE